MVEGAGEGGGVVGEDQVEAGVLRRAGRRGHIRPQALTCLAMPCSECYSPFPIIQMLLQEKAPDQSWALEAGEAFALLGQ